ncbi:hypothetical protein HYQ03_gp33 [Arthrobacter phage Kuleana]|uniref:Uncharacterized protein n=1 Tax=Arthrobacter phage Kuleana TaxID=2653270 RepID=A0A5Q2WE41_9CAUD|nr:hypothetical protein HYQ03_gp33 [Arthrobacter phage Kuleana]QGH74520.1 hypothetical protein SEA_KULEANA_33 [Arthrobacter phage Kuleana]
MERTENQIHAAARELQRKMDAHWIPSTILVVKVTVSEDLAHIIIQAQTPDGDELERNEQPANTGAWELYRQAKLTAAYGMLEENRRYLAEAKRTADSLDA